MSIAGPSRLPLRRVIESTYEQDLLKLLDHLSLEERDEIQAALTNRTSTGGQLSDHEVALNDLIQQARELEAFNQDRMLAERIATAEDSDIDVDQEGVGTRVPGKRTQTKREKKKRKQHEEVDQSPPEIPHVVLPRSSTDERNDIKGKGKELHGDIGQTVDSEGYLELGSQTLYEPSSTSTNNVVINIPRMNRPTGHDCVICLDPIYGTEIRAPCSHYYDINCVIDLFKSATRDETLFPPRCCKQNIPLTQVRRYLSQTLIATFKEKEKEFSTLKRVYCSSPTCSWFLGPLSEGDSASKVYTCPASGCGRQTCGKCREQHNGDWTHVCRPDADATEILELSRTSGWARCPGCSQMIELNLGCFHMICRCRTEFCYLCRARWKTCPCRQWDEWRLLAAAEQRVDAQLRVDRGRIVRPHWAVGLRFVPPFVPYAQHGMNPERVVRPAPAAGWRAHLHEPLPPVFVPARPVFATVEQRLENIAQARPAPRAPAPAATRSRTAPRLNRRPVNNASTIAPAELAPPTHPVVRLPAASSSNGRPANVAPTPEGLVAAEPTSPMHFAVRLPTGRPDNIAPTPEALVPVESVTRPLVRLPTLSSSNRRPEHGAPTSEHVVPAEPASDTQPVVHLPNTTGFNGRPTNIAPTPENPMLAEPAQWTVQTTEYATQPIVHLPSASSSKGRPAPTPAIPTRTPSDPVTAPASGQAHRPKLVPHTDDMRERMIHDMMERLRVDHDCDHAQWRYQNGGGRCENCEYYLPLYLFRCQGCDMLACNRCRRNRL